MKLKQRANKNYPRLKKGTTTYLTLIKLRDIEEKIASRITFLSRAFYILRLVAERSRMVVPLRISLALAAIFHIISGKMFC